MNLIERMFKIRSAMIIVIIYAFADGQLLLARSLLIYLSLYDRLFIKPIMECDYA